MTDAPEYTIVNGVKVECAPNVPLYQYRNVPCYFDADTKGPKMRLSLSSLIAWPIGFDHKSLRMLYRSSIVKLPGLSAASLFTVLLNVQAAAMTSEFFIDEVGPRLSPEACYAMWRFVLPWEVPAPPHAHWELTSQLLSEALGLIGLDAISLWLQHFPTFSHPLAIMVLLPSEGFSEGPLLSGRIYLSSGEGAVCALLLSYHSFNRQGVPKRQEQLNHGLLSRAHLALDEKRGSALQIFAAAPGKVGAAASVKTPSLQEISVSALSKEQGVAPKELRQDWSYSAEAVLSAEVAALLGDKTVPPPERGALQSVSGVLSSAVQVMPFPCPTFAAGGVLTPFTLELELDDGLYRVSPSLADPSYGPPLVELPPGRKPCAQAAWALPCALEHEVNAYLDQLPR